MSTVFAFSCCDFGGYRPILFYSENEISEVEWRAIVTEVVNELVFPNVMSSVETTISWNDVIDASIPFLQQRGFHRFYPAEVSCGQIGYIDSEEDQEILNDENFKLIQSHNEKIFSKICDELGKK